MKELPEAEIYEKELAYLPYRKSLRKVHDYICRNAPEDGSLIDLMCGPGYLLGHIAYVREDLSLRGVDIDPRYVSYGKKNYPRIDFELGDILTYEAEPCDVVICTGSLHHIPYHYQGQAVKNMADLAADDGFVLISDCHVDDFKTETERRIAAATLGYEYLKETIKNGAPTSVVEPTIDILYNDVMCYEYKSSVKRRMGMFEKVFSSIEVFKTWPDEDTEYGDYIMVCRK